MNKRKDTRFFLTLYHRNLILRQIQIEQAGEGRQFLGIDLIYPKTKQSRVSQILRLVNPSPVKLHNVTNSAFKPPTQASSISVGNLEDKAKIEQYLACWTLLVIESMKKRLSTSAKR